MDVPLCYADEGEHGQQTSVSSCLIQLLMFYLFEAVTVFIKIKYKPI